MMFPQEIIILESNRRSWLSSGDFRKGVENAKNAWRWEAGASQDCMKTVRVQGHVGREWTHAVLLLGHGNRGLETFS